MLTIIRTDQDQGWYFNIMFRVYNPDKERVPDFESSNAYTYMGVDWERTPMTLLR